MNADTVVDLLVKHIVIHPLHSGYIDTAAQGKPADMGRRRGRVHDNPLPGITFRIDIGNILASDIQGNSLRRQTTCSSTKDRIDTHLYLLADDPGLACRFHKTPLLTVDAAATVFKN